MTLNPSPLQTAILAEMAQGHVIHLQINRWGRATDAKLTDGTTVPRVTLAIMFRRKWVKRSGCSGFRISAEGRREIARKASLSRWGKK